MGQKSSKGEGRFVAIPAKKITAMLSLSIQNQVGHIPYHAQLNFVLIETKFPIFKQLKAEWKVYPKPSKEPQGCEKRSPQITEDSLALRKKEGSLANCFFPLTALSKIPFLMSFSSSERQLAVPEAGCYSTADSSSWRATQAGLEVAEEPEIPLSMKMLT